MLTDYHCHLLPELDDGAADRTDALTMGRTLSAAGFGRVCCTPHGIRGAYDTSPSRVRLETQQLQELFQAEGVDLQLVPGLEYYLDEFFLEGLDDPLPLPGDLILVEISSRYSNPDGIPLLLTEVLRRGLTPLIAHPERCNLLAPTVVGNRSLASRVGDWLDSRSKPTEPRGDASLAKHLLTELRAIGCKFQGNYGSFTGFYGEQARYHAEQFLAAGLYSYFGSDAHQPRYLSHYLLPGMQRARGGGSTLVP